MHIHVKCHSFAATPLARSIPESTTNCVQVGYRSGWIPEAKTKGGSRGCASRPRVDKTSTEPKVRWSPGWCSDVGASLRITKLPDFEGALQGFT